MIKMRSSLRRPLKYDQTMPFLRHDLLRPTTALLAAFAVLFVSTASIACEAPVDQDMAVHVDERRRRPVRAEDRQDLVP